MDTRALVVSGMTLALTAGLAAGQVLSQPRERGRPPDIGQQDEAVGRRQPALIPVDWVVDSRVLGTNRERLGELGDLVVDPERGRVVFGLLEHGGMLGVNQNTVPVPWNKFEWDPMNRVLSVPLSSDRLNSAPRLDRGEWQRLTDAEWRRRLEGFFEREGLEDHEVLDRWAGMVRDGRDVTVRGTVRDVVSLEPLSGMGTQRALRIATNDGDERVVVLGPSWFVDRQRDLVQRGQQVEVKASSVNVDNRTVLVARNVRTGRGTYTLLDDDGRAPWRLKVDGDERIDRDDRTARDDRREAQDEIRGTLVRVSDLRGQRLVDDQNNEIGRIDTVVFNPDNGKIGYVVLSTGGFMGIADSRHAVPWKFFEVNRQGRIAAKDLERGQLEGAPKIETRNWAELSDPQFERRVYQHFGADRDWDRDDDRSWRRDDRRDEDRRRGVWDSDREDDQRSRDATDLQRKFASGASQTFEGTVAGLNRAGSGGVVELTVRTEDGERVVKLIPARDLDAKEVVLRQGQHVRVRGKQADIDGQRVIIAQEVTIDGRRFELRDRNGYVTDDR
jgi:sporulation protein YlmC with PRC-barrel domain